MIATLSTIFSKGRTFRISYSSQLIDRRIIRRHVLQHQVLRPQRLLISNLTWAEHEMTDLRKELIKFEDSTLLAALIDDYTRPF